ncbi:MAG: flagellin [Chloroflexi bacterium]|nr:flagellin [Chloroflexota bacterium]
MNGKLNRVVKEERGITALETAIILIAFVVVAAIFAFTVLTTGTFLTERSKEASYSGLEEVSSSMQLEGSVVLESTGDTIVFDLATVAGGSSVDLTKVTMTYRDSTTNQNLTYDTGVVAPSANHWISSDTGGSNAVTILAAGQLAHITVEAPASITANQTFSLQVTPPTGGVLLIQRTAPAQITQVTDLH